MPTRDDSTIIDIQYLTKHHGFRAWVKGSNDSLPADEQADTTYLSGVLALLFESNNALNLYKMFVLHGDELIPDEPPAGFSVIDGLEYEGSNLAWMPTFHHLPTQTDWCEIRLTARTVMLRALWSHGLVRFCAAMPQPTVYNRNTLGARHTEHWLAECQMGIAVDFVKYWRVRNTQIAHAGKSSSPRAGATAPYLVLTEDLVLRWIDATAPDPDLRFNPEPEDGDRLIELVHDAMHFTIVRLQQKSRINPVAP